MTAISDTALPRPVFDNPAAVDSEAPASATTIDVDVHVAPASIQDLAPYLSAYWNEYFEDAETDLSPTAGASYPVGFATSGNPLPQRLETLRSDYLDVAQPATAILNCVSSFGANRNPYCQVAVTSAINDWMAKEWLDRDSRLRGSIVVPSVDVRAAVAEIDRVGADGRFVQVLLPVRGHDARYGHVRFREIFEAADRHGLVVGLHAWGRRGSAPVNAGFTNTYIDDYLLNSQVLVQEQLVSLVTEGVFDQFPDLHVALLECGFSWLPALMMRFQKDWKAIWREVPWMKHEPAHYLLENIRASTEPVQLPPDPVHVRQILDQIGAGDVLMFASDFPHHHGGERERLLDALTAEERSAVLHGNARDFYRLDA